ATSIPTWWTTTRSGRRISRADRRERAQPSCWCRNRPTESPLPLWGFVVPALVGCDISIPPPLVGGGLGERCARSSAPKNPPLSGSFARVLRACRRETPPPAPAHKGRARAHRIAPGLWPPPDLLSRGTL